MITPPSCWSASCATAPTIRSAAEKKPHPQSCDARLRSLGVARCRDRQPGQSRSSAGRYIHSWTLAQIKSYLDDNRENLPERKLVNIVTRRRMRGTAVIPSSETRELTVNNNQRGAIVAALVIAVPCCHMRWQSSITKLAHLFSIPCFFPGATEFTAKNIYTLHMVFSAFLWVWWPLCGFGRPRPMLGWGRGVQSIHSPHERIFR